MRRNLRRARNRHDRHRFACRLEESVREVRKYCRDARTSGDVLKRGDATVIACRDDETARAELEVEQQSQSSLRLAHEIPARHPDVRRAVGDEVRNLSPADENRLELATER